MKIGTKLWRQMKNPSPVKMEGFIRISARNLSFYWFINRKAHRQWNSEFWSGICLSVDSSIWKHTDRETSGVRESHIRRAFTITLLHTHTHTHTRPFVPYVHSHSRMFHMRPTICYISMCFMLPRTRCTESQVWWVRVECCHDDVVYV